MVFDDDQEEAVTPTDEATSDSLAEDEGGPGAEVDRTALSALVREVGATHFTVWTVTDSGLLQSLDTPVADVSQQISLASRLMGRNFDQAMQMVMTASNAFDAAAQQWEAQVQQSEQKLRANRNMGKLNQIKGQHNQIRTRIAPVQSVFRRTILMLQEVVMRYQREAAGSAETEPEAENES